MEMLDSQHADELATLLALGDEGSFAAAGRALQRHPSVLSKRLSALERRLGIRLVERTTRQLHLTHEGLRLIEKVREAMGLIAQAQKEAAEGARQVRGRLRISVPAAMGRRLLSPMLAEFALAHPQVTLEVEYADRLVDLVGEHFDAAIRIGNPASWAFAEQARDDSGGLIDMVSDDEILAAYRFLASQESVFVEPASAASVAGLLKMHAAGRVPRGARIVCTVTGNGLKDPHWALEMATDPIRIPVNADAAAEAIGIA